MKILLTDISDEGLDVAFEEDIQNGSLNLLSPVSASLHIKKFGHEIIVSGDVRTTAELQCSRCAKNFSKDISVRIQTVYHPFEELKGEETHEIKNDELDLGFYKGEEFDLSEAISEQIFLNMPMKPLCSETCKGICPQCGRDLNIEACGCEAKSADPRMAALKDLLIKGKE